jgi:hypothetical protein
VDLACGQVELQSGDDSRKEEFSVEEFNGFPDNITEGRF